MATWIDFRNYAPGDRVHHWESGRSGTVVQAPYGPDMEVQFDLVNCAGVRDGVRKWRSKNVFVAGDPPAMRPGYILLACLCGRGWAGVLAPYACFACRLWP